MKHQDLHLSDQQLLMDVDGELPVRDQKLVNAHLQACWNCRVRRQELERTIAGLVRSRQEEFEAKLPPAAGPRALLKARLGQVPVASSDSNWFVRGRRLAWTLAAATSALAVLSLFLFRFVNRENNPRRAGTIVSIPDSRLTPGAAVLESRQAVCSQENIKNKAVSVSLRRKVFEEYGMADAEPQAYEVDYLVTPALGGADDIRNLWPHSYSSTGWNAQVKDALEDRLRQMVCDGNLDLSEAQREIAGNWIAAYKKYFRTDKPLPQHSDTELR